MKRCQSIIDDLKAYADCELPPLRQAMVQLHISRCPSCREEIEAMDKISANLVAGDAGDLTMDLRSRLLEAAPEGAPLIDRVTAKRWRPRPLQIWSAAAAAVLMW